MYVLQYGQCSLKKYHLQFQTVYLNYHYVSLLECDNVFFNIFFYIIFFKIIFFKNYFLFIDTATALINKSCVIVT